MKREVRVSGAFFPGMPERTLYHPLIDMLVTVLFEDGRIGGEKSTGKGRNFKKSKIRRFTGIFSVQKTPYGCLPVNSASVIGRKIQHTLPTNKDYGTGN